MIGCAPDSSKDTIDEAYHLSKFNAEKINHVVERVARGDDQFTDQAIDQLQDLQFPAFKHKMLEHVRRKIRDQDILGLFESLD